MGSVTPPSTSRPAFRWAGVAMLLPVALLVAAGALVLWRDHRAAERELRDRARAVAEETVRAVNLALGRLLAERPAPGESPGWWLEFDAGGRLVQPVFSAGPPIPAPLEPGELSVAQSLAWRAAQAAGGLPVTNQVRVWEEFLATAPPARFSFHAELALASCRRRAGEPAAALLRLAALHPRVQREFSESGLPLAQWVALEWFAARVELPGVPLPPDGAGIHTNPAAYWEPWLTAGFSRQPTLLSGRLAQAADAALGGTASRGSTPTGSFADRWRAAEELRALAVSVLGRNGVGVPAGGVPPSQPPPPVSRFDHRGQPWFALRAPPEGADALTGAGTGVGATGHPVRIRLLPLAQLLEVVEPSLVVAAGALPYTTTTVGLGGVRLGRADLVPEQDRPAPRLAEATAGGAPWPLTATVWLQNPQGFFAALRERTLLFSLLIALAAVSALVGFVMARRAFERQQRLTAMKSNFVSSVSHELRAPLASVRLMAEGLARGTVTDPVRQAEYHRFIVQECRRLSALIDNVLDFARIEQGRKEYDFSSTDLVALVKHTLHLLEPVAAERRVRLVAELPAAGSLEGDVDGQAVQQALINLLDNAIKYSPPGGPVRVRLVAVPAAAPNRVELCVSDEGPGIPVAEHARIFERFYRVGSELRRETQGVGIGLSIVEHIAQAHRGRVVVDSAPGRGSTFRLELPLVQSAGMLPAPAPGPERRSHGKESET